ncbi:hypothetical protein [Streptomyces sp. HUAS TT20]|uniref:hypothetical protein n=1 Tax=Streptomyces sp. HUAS TT20 TaxID=3447509 RepID=UPI0021DABA8A|nr:hypothetical protein [Streptomyces sp. HUAS 15-9]UXY29420.1 hypothetical protein N8I87_24580 [Streptomyces sp. HUAS 15-9]
MTSPAVQPVTGVRVLRTAAGRRALQLGLLMAGLFALGLLCGERAHAAEGTPPGTSAASVTSAASTASVAPVSSVVTDVTDAAQAAPWKAATKSVVGAVAASVTTPVTASVEHTGRRVAAAVPTVDQGAVASVTRRATRPVGDLVGAVTRQLGTVRGKLPALPASPSLPGLPGMSELPGRLLPAPVTSAPGTTHDGAARPAAVSGEDVRGTTARTPKPVRSGAYGPDLSAATPAPRSVVHADGRRAAAPGTAPSSPAPTGDQGGAPGRSAVDNGSPRHGDANAVTLNDRAPLRLAPGAAARVDAAGTRDRHRDIPVFPG